MGKTGSCAAVAAALILAGMAGWAVSNTHDDEHDSFARAAF